MNRAIMGKGVLRVATCQFAVSASIGRNSLRICEFVRRAKKAKADIVHLPECALCGYAGADLRTPDELDWDLLRQQSRKIMALAGRLKIWVVLGSTHRLSGGHKPHNSLYLINPAGRIVDRYDKRFCTPRDLEHYTPGSRFVYFTVKRVRCALLICFDLRFPELYRELYKSGVDCLLQSFYNARQMGPSVHTVIMRQSMQCRAATNHFWVSMANASGYYSPYPSCFIEPDGRIVGQLRANRAGMMVNEVDLRRQFYDPMVDFREMAIAGKLNNGPENVKDPRSSNTTSL